MLRVSSRWFAVTVALAACSSGGDEGTCGAGGCDGGAEAETGTGGADGTADGGQQDAGPGPCQLASLPAKPTGTSGGGGETFVASLRQLSYGTAAVRIGFDLDAEVGESGCVARGAAADCPVDNAFGQLLVESRIDETAFDPLIEEGLFSLLVRVREYGGGPDDDAVSVDLLVAAPFDTMQDGAVPALDGQDVWSVSSLSLAEGSFKDARYTSSAAWVTRGRLAARFDEALVQLPFGFGADSVRPVDLLLSDVSLTCEIVSEGPARHLRGCVLGAVLPAAALLGQLPRFTDPFPPAVPLCTDAAGYGLVKQGVCKHTDRGAGECDALSVGARFETVAAFARNAYITDPFAADCASESDPAADSCALD